MKCKTLLAMLTTALLSQSLTAAASTFIDTPSEAVILPPAAQYHFMMGIGFNNSRVDDQIHGITFTNQVNDDASLFRDFLYIDPETQVGFNAVAGIQLTDNMAIKTTYQRWHHSDRASYYFQNASDAPIVFPTNTAERILGKVHYRYDTVNLYFTQGLPEVKKLVSHIMLGAKWTHLYMKKTQIFDVLVTNGESYDGFLQESIESTFNGVGPLVGLDGRYPIYGAQGQFGIFGEAAVSILVDNMKAKNDNIIQARLDFGVFLIDFERTQAEKRDYDGRVVYNSSVKLGLDYQTKMNNVDVRIAGGVQIDYYRDVVRAVTGTSIDSDFYKSGLFGELSIAV